MRTWLFLVMVFAPQALYAQQEQPVNQHTADTQRDPAVAMNRHGQSVVVWTSIGQDGDAEGVYARRFDATGRPAGDEMPVNTATVRPQYQPAVAMHDDGHFVVVWTGHADTTLLDVYARIFRPDGAAAGPAFRVNATAAHSQAAPDVAMDAEGDFVVAWHSWNQDGGDRGVYARRYAPDGAPRSGEVPVNVETAYSQAHPAVAMAPGGRWVVAWASWKKDAPGVWSYDVHARLFEADGSPGGLPFQVNAFADDNQWHADVAMDPQGGFVVAWTSWGQDGDEGGVYARRYDAAGVPLGEEVPVNETTAAYQWLPSVAVDAAGAFFIAWSSMHQDGDKEGIYYRLFDAKGIPQTAERPANTFTGGYQWEPAVAWQGEDLLVAWTSWGQDGDRYGVMARRFAAATVDVASGPPEPEALSLAQNHPNPFVAETTIRFAVPRAARVRLEVFDVLGRRIRVLLDAHRRPGVHVVSWDGSGEDGQAVPAGVYIYRLVTAAGVEARPMTLLR